MIKHKVHTTTVCRTDKIWHKRDVLQDQWQYSNSILFTSPLSLWMSQLQKHGSAVVVFIDTVQG